MAQTRKALTIPLVTRDATTSKDSKLVNVYVEDTPNGPEAVKRPGIVTQVSLGAGCAQGAITFNGEAFFIQGDVIYSNLQPFAAGSSWTAATAPPKPVNGSVVGTARGGHLVSVGTSLYSLGGHNNGDSTESIYKSTDNGTSWSTILVTAPWTSFGEVGQRAVNFNGTIFVIPGSRDCWSSTDGISWVRTNANITGDSKDCQGLVVHNGLLYAFFTLAAASSVYKSADGITWTSVTAAPAWAGRRIPGIYSLAGNLYLVGGVDNTSTVKNDVYKSLDNGATWSQITAAAAFAARWGMAAWVYNAKMWLGGGALNSGGSSVDDDIYNSTDGITWTLVTAASGWNARYAPSNTIHNNTLFVGPGLASSGAVSSLHFAALGGAVATALPTPTQNCLPMQIALIPAFGSTAAKAFIKSNKDAWVWDGTTATKVVDADYPATTVFGVAYLDGTIYVMDSKGVIYGSDLLAPLSWNALNFISAISEADAGVAIARQLDNIIAFKETSIEFFYDAGNSVGSPLAKVPNALLEIGLAGFGGSIAYSDNGMFFMAQHRQKGRTVMKFEGTTPKEMSNPWVDRILYADDLATVFGFVVRLQGHTFYVLTLKSSAITLVLDETYNKQWIFTKLKARPSITATSLVVQSNGSILVTLPSAHAANDGDPVVIAGGTPAAVNGSFNIRYDSTVHSTSQFSYIPLTTVSGAITGTITNVFYSSTQFPGAYYARGSNVDLVIDELTGDIYKFDPGIFQDSGAPIDCHIVTDNIDDGTMTAKAYNSLTLVGDRFSGNVLARYSDNDYGTFTKYRLVDMSKNRPRIDQLGWTYQRAFEFRYTGNTAMRLSQAEADISPWNR